MIICLRFIGKFFKAIKWKYFYGKNCRGKQKGEHKGKINLICSNTIIGCQLDIPSQERDLIVVTARSRNAHLGD